MKSNGSIEMKTNITILKSILLAILLLSSLFLTLHSLSVYELAFANEEITVTDNPQGLSRTIRTLKWSPDGSKIAAGFNDKTIRLWDSNNGKFLHKLIGHWDWVRSIDWSPDSSQIVSGSYDKTMRIWDVESGEQKIRVLAHLENVRSVAWSPDGNSILTGADPARADDFITIRQWHPETGFLINSMNQQRGSVYDLEWNPQGTMFASGATDGTVKIWNAASSLPLLNLTGHSRNVYYVKYSPDGSKLASSGGDGVIRISNASSGAEINSYQGELNSIHGIEWDLDDTIILSDGLSTVKWSPYTGEDLFLQPKIEELGGRISLNPDASKIAISIEDEIKVMNISTGEELVTIAMYSYPIDQTLLRSTFYTFLGILGIIVVLWLSKDLIKDILIKINSE